MGVKTGKVLILTAPSGAGKTTIARHLLSEFSQLAFSVSATTRPRREGEIHGKDYYFLSITDFDNKVKQDAFVEWEEVYPGKRYGTLKAEVDRLWAADKVIVFDVDVLGAKNLKAYFGAQSLSLFIQPPDLETLEARLRNRATESDATLQERLRRARMELAQAHHFDRVLTNNNLEQAKAQATEWVSNFLQGKLL